MKKKEETLFVVSYKEPKEGKLQTIKARSVKDSSLGPTFVELSDFVFDDSPLIVNPEAESMKEHFANVKRLHIGIYHIISIEELGPNNKGLALKRTRSNVVILDKQ